MKKRIILSIAAALAVSAPPCLAGLGARAGVNLTTITGEGLDARADPGLVLGLTYRAEIVTNAFLQGEAAFARYRMGYTDSVNQYSARLDYLRLAGLLKVRLAEGPVRPFLEGGADFGLRMHGHVATGSDTTRVEDLYPIDACWILGVGAELAGFLSADLRLSRSLFSIVNKEEFGDLRNFGVTVGLGFSF